MQTSHVTVANDSAEEKNTENTDAHQYGVRKSWEIVTLVNSVRNVKLRRALNMEIKACSTDPGPVWICQLLADIFECVVKESGGLIYPAPTGILFNPPRLTGVRIIKNSAGFGDAEQCKWHVKTTISP